MHTPAFNPSSPTSLQVVPPRSCDICVLGGDGLQPPRGLLPQAQVVREAWLLQLAEEQEPVDPGPFLIT